MISVARAWLAFAAIGAGMIHLALVVGSPVALAIALALLGAAELGWGVAVLARTAVPGPRRSVLAALLAAAMSLAAAALLAPRPAAGVETAALPGPALALLLGAALDVAIALILAATLMLRRRRATRTPADEPQVENLTGGRIARSLAAMAVGALAVGAVTTPALAATEAGRHAQPHGAHLFPEAPTAPPESPHPGGHADH